jgi:hypothetical protein
MAILLGYEIKASWGTSSTSIPASNSVTLEIVRTNTNAAADAACQALYTKLVAEGKPASTLMVWAKAIRLVDVNNQV